MISETARFAKVWKKVKKKMRMYEIYGSEIQDKASGTSAGKTYPAPIVTVDAVPITIKDDKLCVLLGERQNEPYKHSLALIGGYVHADTDKTTGEAAARVLKEKAGIENLYIEQLSTFSGPDRDPRGWSISVSYFSLVKLENLEPALNRGYVLYDENNIPDLPFDHNTIVDAAIKRVRSKALYTDIPARLLEEEFTIKELHQTYCIVMGEDVNREAFKRKALDRGLVERTGERRMVLGSSKPAEIYRLKNKQAIFDRRL
jgi:ADP-ribose pyrophosphatase YjhB (NUDIX family)